jgi:hypothetical protein
VNAFVFVELNQRGAGAGVERAGGESKDSSLAASKQVAKDAKVSSPTKNKVCLLKNGKFRGIYTYTLKTDMRSLGFSGRSVCYSKWFLCEARVIKCTSCMH